MSEFENQVNSEHEEFEVSVELDEGDVMATICANCNKVLYTATLADATTLAVADLVGTDHCSFFKTPHEVVTITRNRPL